MMEMIQLKTKIDLVKLKSIADITRKAWTKKGKLKSPTIRHRKLFEKAFGEYVGFWTKIIHEAFPEYDFRKYKICMYKIKVSEEADKYIQRILLPMDYLDYSPAVDPRLKDDECIIEDGVLVLKEEVDING